MSRLEEKQQKILKSLLQEPGNKRCADCGAKGPVYANVTHYTFVCTTCSGIHREFNTRVKSISMASFKPEEIKGLQEGGNDAHRAIWLARWNSDNFPEPTVGDTESIRRFLRMKYIEKKWYKAPSKKTEEVKPEPLTNILGNNIPPIKVDNHVNERKIAQFSAFEDHGNSSSNLSSSQDHFNPFATEQKSSTEEFNPFVSSSQPQKPTDIFSEPSKPTNSSTSSNNTANLFGGMTSLAPSQPEQPIQAQPPKKSIDLNSLYQQQAIQNQMRMSQGMGLQGLDGLSFGVQSTPVQPGFGMTGQPTPQTGFGMVPQGYGMPPQQGYGMPPQQGFGMVPQGYGMPPQQGYGMPPQTGFGMVPQGYGMPPQQGLGMVPQQSYTVPPQQVQSTPQKPPEPAKPDPFASLLSFTPSTAQQQKKSEPQPSNDWPF